MVRRMIHMFFAVQALVDELEERLDVCHSKGVEDEEAINKATKASRALREKGNRKSPRKTPRKSPKNAATGMFYTTVVFNHMSFNTPL